MYLIELILKKWFEKRNKKNPVLFEEKEPDNELYENCEQHIYMSIDSTNDFLACKNCGHVLRNPKDKNFRINHALYDKF